MQLGSLQLGCAWTSGCSSSSDSAGTEGTSPRTGQALTAWRCVSQRSEGVELAPGALLSLCCSSPHYLGLDAGSIPL